MKFAAMLAVLLLLVLPTTCMTLVHAQTVGGTFSGITNTTDQTTLPNGTVAFYEADNVVLQGPFSGNSTEKETDYYPPNSGGAGTFHIIGMFTGSFNGSKVGSITFVDTGTFASGGYAFQESGTFSRGTGGLAGLHGTLTARGSLSAGNEGCDPLVNEVGCTFTGTYTVTSASWGTTPVPEFSNLAIIVIFASTLCLIMLKRKKDT